MKKIIIRNFRCFSEQNITFREGVNLFVGDNAAGKTSVLQACKYVLSAFFSGFSDDNTKWVSLDENDFRIEIINGIISPEKPINIEFDVDDIIVHAPIYHFIHQMYNNDDILPNKLVKNSKKNSRSLVTGIKDLKEYTHQLYNKYFTSDGQIYDLPLFASFSTEDIHAKRKIDVKKFKLYNHKPSFGYYECLEGDGFFPYWIKRLLVLKEGRENNSEIAIVKQAIKDALGSNGCGIIDDISIRPIQNKVYFIYTDGREVESKHLSDGYRRLVNIVIDIAFRCALLNYGIFGSDTCKKTIGTVLIDEIDLHLHPTLQSKVLRGLKNAFPRIQFIVTTHAPMVMSGVQTNEHNIVYKLEYKDEQYRISSIEPFGMDLSTITEAFLEQIPRVKEANDEINNLFALIDEDDIDKAKEVLNVLENKYKNMPELAQAKSMIQCIEIDNEED